MKQLATLPLLLLLALHVSAQDVSLVVPEGQTQIVVKAAPFTVVAPTGADLYFWQSPPGVQSADKGHVLAVLTAPKGRHLFLVKTMTIDWEKKKIDQKFGQVSVIVGESPGPDPSPDPDPDPDPDPPIPTGGLTVLILYESADKAKLPSAQSQIFTSVPVRQYLQAKCVADPSPVATDGKAYRIWDDDETGEGDSKLWRDILKRAPRNNTPWIYVSNGKAFFEGSLPLTPDATIELLKKYAGP